MKHSKQTIDKLKKSLYKAGGKVIKTKNVTSKSYNKGGKKPKQNSGEVSPEGFTVKRKDDPYEYKILNGKYMTRDTRKNNSDWIDVTGTKFESVIKQVVDEESSRQQQPVMATPPPPYSPASREIPKAPSLAEKQRKEYMSKSSTPAEAGVSSFYKQQESKKPIVTTPSKEMTFSEAFAAARKAGKDIFEYRGKKYTTELKKEKPKTDPRIEEAVKEITYDLSKTKATDLESPVMYQSSYPKTAALEGQTAKFSQFLDSMLNRLK